MREFSHRIHQGDRDDALRLLCPSTANAMYSGVICPAWNPDLPYHYELASLKLPIDDEDNVPPWMFDLAVLFHKNQTRTFVHCHGGLNRSIIFTAALLHADGMEAHEALRTVREATRDFLPYPPLITSYWKWIHTLGK